MDLPDTLEWYLREDAPFGDITSEAVIPAEAACRAVIQVRADGVIAGLEEFVSLAREKGLATRLYARDGETVRSGSVVAECTGNARAVLLIERTALNIMGRMSGIATRTAELARMVKTHNPECRVTATRKTAPGCRLIDKKAVSLGGGDPHRTGLSDGVLIKDNHLALVPLVDAVRNARHSSRYHLVEVEVEDTASAIIAAREGADIVLLDNMDPGLVKETCDALLKAGLRARVLLEASGGITRENLGDFASAGVDRISLGCLTHSVKNLDISMEITPN